METVRDLKTIFDMLLSVPDGMNAQVKLDFKMSRQGVLILTQIMQRAFGKGDSEAIDMLLSVASEDAIQELIAIGEQWLQKADLTDLNEKLKQLLKK